LSRLTVQIGQLRKGRKAEVGNPRDLEVSQESYRGIIKGGSPGDFAGQPGARKKTVRIYGLKQEGGELFMKYFRKL